MIIDNDEQKIGFAGNEMRDFPERLNEKDSEKNCPCFLFMRKDVSDSKLDCRSNG